MASPRATTQALVLSAFSVDSWGLQSCFFLMEAQPTFLLLPPEALISHK